MYICHMRSYSIRGFCFYKLSDSQASTSGPASLFLELQGFFVFVLICIISFLNSLYKFCSVSDNVCMHLCSTTNLCKPCKHAHNLISNVIQMPGCSLEKLTGGTYLEGNTVWPSNPKLVMQTCSIKSFI